MVIEEAAREEAMMKEERRQKNFTTEGKLRRMKRTTREIVGKNSAKFMYSLGNKISF